MKTVSLNSTVRSSARRPLPIRCCPLIARPNSTLSRSATIQDKIREFESTNGVVSSSALTDSFRRGHNALRISLTEKCNLRCTYCMPAEGVELSPKDDMLTTQEILRLATLFAQHGITKIRLTGGEPTLRRDLAQIIEGLAAIPQIDFIGMTTNGLTLPRKLPSLIQAGLNNVNISLDTVDPHKFELMTRRRGHSAVLRALDVATSFLPSQGNSPMKHAQLSSVKLNAVVIRGVNDYELFDFVELAKNKRIDIRFIEYMPFDGNRWETAKLVPSKEMLQRLQASTPDLLPVEGRRSDTSKVWSAPGWKGSVGFISSMSDHFCGGCSRLRLGSDGGFKVCLFGPAKLNLRELLRQGSTDDELLHHIGVAIKGKHFAHDGKTSPSALAESRNAPMVKIGGVSRLRPWMHSPRTSSALRLYHATPQRLRHKPSLTHIDEEGNAQMVDVSDKSETSRSATAVGIIHLSQHAFDLLDAARNKKGSPLAVAQLAGIMACKKTADIIPLCHPLPISGVNVELVASDQPAPQVKVTATVKTNGRTGVEMEALTAVSAACLTVHDMVKSAGQQDLQIDGIRVIEKRGGKSRDWIRGAEQ